MRDYLQITYILSEFNTRDYTKIIGTDISITCGASKLTTFAITEDRVKWVTEGRSLMITILNDGNTAFLFMSRMITDTHCVYECFKIF